MGRIGRGEDGMRGRGEEEGKMGKEEKRKEEIGMRWIRRGGRSEEEKSIV